jgi:hypothetical protein
MSASLSFHDRDAGQRPSHGSIVYRYAAMQRLVVLVEEQVQLVEGRPGHLPVMLLVQIGQRDGVGEQLIQVLDALLAR